VSKASQVLLETLRGFGVELVFGIPSVHNIGFYEAMREAGSVRHVLCRTEAGAVHMADGYARTGRGLGVAVASTGPGAGYTVAPLMEAWASCSPVLVLNSNIASGRIGAGEGKLHEIPDQASIFRSMTKATFSPRSADEVGPTAREAATTALTGRPGPVYLEVPVDLWDKETGEGPGPPPDTAGPAGPSKGLAEAIERVRKARRPVIVVGEDAGRAGLGPLVMALAERLGAPVVTETQAGGAVPADHPLVFGVAPRKGAIRATLEEADLALALGTRLREADIKRHGVHLAPLIHADWDETWMGRNYEPLVRLPGNLGTTLAGLLAGLETAPRPAWADKQSALLKREIETARETHPVEMAYLKAIREALPRNGDLIVDNTQLGYWAEYFYPAYEPGGLTAAKGATILGFAFPAAMGRRLALPDRPLAALIGDGGFLYCAQELATCRRHGLGFPLIVVNDQAYGVIGYLQNLFYRQKYENALVNPDFVALAMAFGVSAVRVDSPEGLHEALVEALSAQDMRLIELAARFEEPPFRRY